MDARDKNQEKRVGLFFIFLMLLFFSGSFVSAEQLSLVAPPTVNSNWSLGGVHFTSPDDGWVVAYGYYDENCRGVLLHYSGGTWTSVIPPSVCSDWDLWGVHFTSADEGWAVGLDYTIGKGVLLHHSWGRWTSVTPPSDGAYLAGVYLTSPDEGWAVGYDNEKGVLLHYSASSNLLVTN